MDSRENTLAVIGGGAAGLAAAIAAGQAAAARDVRLQVTVLERDDRVGRSVLATGNGRCNFSNADISVSAYYNDEFVGETLGALAAATQENAGEGANASPVHDFFASCGLVWRQEADGRQYPLANKASAVVDVLRAAASRVGVREVCEAEVAAVEVPRQEGKPFTLRMADGVFRRADAVVVACGGRALPSIAVPETINVLRTRPVLGPLRCAPERAALTRELDNIRVRCAVSLHRRQGGGSVRVMTEAGELMFRKYGVSGICVFNLSRFAWPGDVLRIDFLQMGGSEGAAAFLEQRRSRLAARFGDDLTYRDMLRGLVLPRVAEALLKCGGPRPDDAFSPSDTGRLAELLGDFPLEVAGIADPDVCQVRRGGLAVEGFNPHSMMSLRVPGLFAAGEALDVDGPCGGYNLHWAWASGLLAGSAACDWLVEGVRT